MNETSPERESRNLALLGILTGLGLGFAAAIIGLLPWLLTGARLPPQNLWAVPALPGDMPRALLPVNQYCVTAIVALLAAGGVAAGFLGRRFRFAGHPAAAVTIGLVVAQAIAVAQSFTALRHGLGLMGQGLFEPGPARPTATLYWWGMLIGAVVTLTVVAVAAWLMSRASRGSVALGLVLVAVPIGEWVGVWLDTVGGPTGPPTATGQVVRWIPPLVVAAALIWCGFGSVRHRAVWLAGAAVLLIIPTVFTAISSALGTRVLHGDPVATYSMMTDVLRSSATLGVVPAMVALALAAAGVMLKRAAGRTASA